MTPQQLLDKLDADPFNTLNGMVAADLDASDELRAFLYGLLHEYHEFMGVFNDFTEELVGVVMEGRKASCQL